MKDLLLKRKNKFALYVFACFFPIVTDLLNVWALSRLIGSIQVGTMENFWQNLLLGACTSLSGVVLFIISRFMRIGFMRDTILDVRLSAFEKILKHSYERFNRNSKEVYVSNLINDVNTFEQDFFLKLLNVIYTGGKYVAAIGILLFLDFRFALGTAAVSILLYIISNRFEKRTVSMKNQISGYNEEYTVELANTFNGLEILKLNRVEDKFLHNTLKSIDRIERKKRNFTIFTEGQRGFTVFMSNLAFVGMLVYLLFMSFGGMSLTMLALMLQLSAGCVMPIGYVIPMFNELKAAISIYKKITGNGDAAERRPEGTLPYSFREAIVAKNLSFAYEGKAILNNVNFTIEKGRKYLVRGPSGAGKSTLVKILSMIQGNYGGELSMDGVPYGQISESGFNANIAFVYQDVFLFEDTIRNNISLFKEAPDAELLSASAKAGMQDLLDGKPLGLDESLTENGKNLSGGQRQRISIARAIFKKADILFVDEGTASLNEELGRSIEETILSLDSTVIAISHRHYGGVTERYDYVLEINNGAIEQFAAEEYFQEVAV